MAADESTILINIELDDGTIRKAQLKADDLGSALSKSIGDKVSKGIDSSFTGLAIQFQAIAKLASSAFGTISGVIEKSIGEASAADTALNNMAIALSNIGANTPGAVDQIASVAAELQNLGTVSDDAVLSAAQSLVSIGNLSGPALDKATRSAVDLSAGLGVDLNTAFDLVAKAASGNTGALSRYGIKVDENIPKSERFAAALSLIDQRFGGFDAAKANTFGGAITKLGVAFNDIFENLGKFFTQDKTLVAVLNFITGAFKQIGDSISKAFGENKGIVGTFIKQLIEVARTIVSVVGPAFEFLFNLNNAVNDAIMTGLRTIVAGFGTLGFAVNKVLNSVGIVSDETLARSRTFMQESGTALVASAESTATAFKETFANAFSGKFPGTEAIQGFIDDLGAAAATAPELAQKMANGVEAPAQAMADQYASLRQSINKNFGQGVVNVISAGAQAIGASLVQGGKAFDNFLKTVLGIIGDLAIQIGTTLVSIGLGVDALKTSLATLSGGVAIAAGLALIAVGGLLKSLGGGGITANAAGGPASVGGGSTGSDLVTEQPDLISRERRSAVTINVHGNVLDRRESGLEIARVLQEYFDTNDGILARA